MADSEWGAWGREKGHEMEIKMAERIAMEPGGGWERGRLDDLSLFRNKEHKSRGTVRQKNMTWGVWHFICEGMEGQQNIYVASAYICVYVWNE